MDDISGHIDVELARKLRAAEDLHFLGIRPDDVTLEIHHVPSITAEALRIRTAERFIPPERWEQYQRRLRSLDLSA